jgi:hypothetical protein
VPDCLIATTQNSINHRTSINIKKTYAVEGFIEENKSGTVVTSYEYIFFLEKLCDFVLVWYGRERGYKTKISATPKSRNWLSFLVRGRLHLK